MLQKKLDLVGILSNVEEREVFFIDEIHRLQPDVEEMIYSALEDFRMDILIGTGPGARTWRWTSSPSRPSARPPGKESSARLCADVLDWSCD